MKNLFHEVADTLDLRLQRQSDFEDLIFRLEKWGETHSYETGEAICSIGQLPPGLQFVLSGGAIAIDESGIRLFEYSYGDAIETRSGFQPFSTSVTTLATPGLPNSSHDSRIH